MRSVMPTLSCVADKACTGAGKVPQFPANQARTLIAQACDSLPPTWGGDTGEGLQVIPGESRPCSRRVRHWRGGGALPSLALPLSLL